jgi:hypothetical protein|tara:strand:- start:256 stop:651 length:396 start_codon:yes stop_codon:yes gene_type:complete
MKFNEISDTLVKASIKVESIQVIGGWLVGQLGDDDIEFGKEFVMQAIFQMGTQGIQDTRGDEDMHKTFEFQVPIGRVCTIAEMIESASQSDKATLHLKTLWMPFVNAAMEVILGAMKPERRHDELGPENLN